jgi:hypothetical protein
LGIRYCGSTAKRSDMMIIRNDESADYSGVRDKKLFRFNF